MKGEKIDGTLAGRYHGLAHIIEGKYDDAFSAFYGCIDLVDCPEDAHLEGREVRIEVADGRQGVVKVIRTICHEVLGDVEEAPGRTFSHYFVAVQPLRTFEQALRGTR